MNIEIKNTKVFTVSVNAPNHWSKLPNLIKLMKEKIFIFKSDANLSWANLSKANLSWANLYEANLSWANLSKANLSKANLSEANLSEANLSWANLSDANLSEANLSEANLSWANLSDANLSWANLSDAKIKDEKDKELTIKDFIVVGGIGSAKRQTIFFNTDAGIYVHCGCFMGYLKDFVKQVKDTHNGTNYEKEYLQAVKLAKTRFNKKENK